MMICTIPVLPPSANNLHANVAEKGRVKTPAYAKWRNAAVLILKSQGRGETIAVPYRLHIEAERPRGTKRARDLDNIIKPISDACKLAGLIEDDCLAERVSAAWSDEIEGIRITLQAMNERMAA